MKIDIWNSKMLFKELKSRTNNEFYLNNTKGDVLTIIIARNNKLIINKSKFITGSYTNKDFKEFLDFIDR